MELLAIFVALQIADIITTHRALSQGGRELNPLLARMFERLGVLPSLLCMKTLAIGLVLAAIWYDQMPDIVLAGLDALYAAIVFHNFRQIKG